MLYSHIQPLPDDQLLLVGARARYRNKREHDLNGNVFSCDGNRIRRFFLGDGIADVQTTSAGTIWASYFDEGVVWKSSWGEYVPGEIGASGLLAWDQMGEHLYAFHSENVPSSLYDCYALNVRGDDDVWFYYHDGFPLVNLANDSIRDYWQSPVKGAQCFAISDEYALFYGGYDKRYVLRLFKYQPGQMLKLSEVYRGVSKPDAVAARGDTIVFLKNHRIYRVSIDDLVVPN